jgi:hypothetical protein
VSTTRAIVQRRILLIRAILFHVNAVMGIFLHSHDRAVSQKDNFSPSFLMLEFLNGHA